MSVFCGQCPLEFADDTAYLAHTCEVSGVKPTDPEFMGKNWDTIQVSAIDRGAPDSTPGKVAKAKDDIKALKDSKVK